MASQGDLAVKLTKSVPLYRNTKVGIAMMDQLLIQTPLITIYHF